MEEAVLRQRARGSAWCGRSARGAAAVKLPGRQRRALCRLLTRRRLGRRCRRAPPLGRRTGRGGGSSDGGGGRGCGGAGGGRKWRAGADRSRLPAASRAWRGGLGSGRWTGTGYRGGDSGRRGRPRGGGGGGAPRATGADLPASSVSAAPAAAAGAPEETPATPSGPPPPQPARPTSGRPRCSGLSRPRRGGIYCLQNRSPLRGAPLRKSAVVVVAAAAEAKDRKSVV